MPSYKVFLDELADENVLKTKKPDANKEYPIIGLLDSGINEIEPLQPWLLKRKHTNYPSDKINSSHGTFVAGVITYGDELEEETYTGLDGCYLFDATVFPDLNKETIYQDELIENIREAIANNSDIKIWNLSLGTREECDENIFSDFGMALDSIQDEYEILIVKSAGNSTSFITGAPKPRIAKSADSVRSIVVGSIAHKQSKYDVAKKNNPSPFTRIGRGPSYIIKPDVVHYGGNAGVEDGEPVIINLSILKDKINSATATIVKYCALLLITISNLQSWA